MRANYQNSFKFLYLTCILNSAFYLVSLKQRQGLFLVMGAARVVSAGLFVEHVLSCDGCVAGL